MAGIAKVEGKYSGSVTESSVMARAVSKMLTNLFDPNQVNDMTHKELKLKLSAAAQNLKTATDLFNAKSTEENYKTFFEMKPVEKELEKEPETTALTLARQNVIEGYSQVKRQIVGAISGSFRSVLLYGPKGCGKSSLAVLFGMPEDNENIFMSLIHANMSQQKQTPNNHLLKIKRELEKAIEKKPSVVIIDDIQDFFLSLAGNAPAYLIRTREEILDLITKIHVQVPDVLLIGCTNKISGVDIEILRRFGTRIFVDQPNIFQREKILKHYLKGKTSPEISPAVFQAHLNFLSCLTYSRSGSEIKAIVERASYGRPTTQFKHLYEVLERTRPAVVEDEMEFKKFHKATRGIMQAEKVILMSSK